MAYVYRFFNPTSGEHFYTADPGERNGLIAGNPAFRYEGVEMTIPSSGSYAAVYRFYRRDTGTHFYTTSVVERDYINANLGATYAQDSATYGASATQTGDATQAVYRFFDVVSGVHFFTASEAERDGVLATLPTMRYEGIAYYTSPAPVRVVGSGALDESWYLSAYPDVRDAVRAGTISAAAHYATFGAAEGRLPNAPASLAGNDDVTSAYSAPRYGDTLHGGAGNDTLRGGEGDDTLFGETGDDVLYGYPSENLNGGDGNDTYYVYSSTVTISEGVDAGDDYERIFIAEGSVRIPANVEHVRFWGGTTYPPANSRLVIVGSSGNDDIQQSTTSTDHGDPNYASRVELQGGDGNDTLVGSVSSTIYGGSGNDSMTAGYWVYYRSLGIYYQSGNDTIYGESGDDTIVGSAGNDLLSGGSGQDTFKFDLTTRTREGAVGAGYGYSGTSTITDFEAGTDRVLLVGTSLSAEQILARFSDYTSSLPEIPNGVRAVFTSADFRSPASTGTLTINLQNLSQAQLSSSSFAVG